MIKAPQIPPSFKGCPTGYCDVDNPLINPVTVPCDCSFEDEDEDD